MKWAHLRKHHYHATSRKHKIVYHPDYHRVYLTILGQQPRLYK